MSFDVPSYAGWLGITVVADPDLVPELDLLARNVGDRLRALVDDGAQGPVSDAGG